MNRRKILTIYFVLIAVGFISATTYHNLFVSNGTIQGEKVIGINFAKFANVNKKTMFNTMADIQNYPKILPGNVISVKIINQTDAPVSKIIFAEEKVSESGVITTLIVKHGIVPFDKHNVEVMNGDAKGTIIQETFNENGTGVILVTNATIHVHGLLAPFGTLLRPNLEHAMNTVIDKFIEYTKNQNTS